MICLFIISVIPKYGFEGKILVLIVPVPDHCLSFTIGIKHVLPCINFRWVPREVFNIARGTQRMLMHGKVCSIAIIA